MANKFQFQYGTIKRIRLITYYPADSRFQFQYGTIKRYVVRRPVLEESDFNSSMVRLRGVFTTQSSQSLI